jgi:hypothetical protein
MVVFAPGTKTFLSYMSIQGTQAIINFFLNFAIENKRNRFIKIQVCKAYSFTNLRNTFLLSVCTAIKYNPAG